MKLPILPTIFVAVAVATMIGLGIWQLQRKGEKEALVETYLAASELPPVAWPEPPNTELLYRRATGYCVEPVSWRALAGSNRDGETGWQHIAAKARQVLEKNGVEQVSTQVIDGKPAENIISAAEHEKADLIVMGRRGLGDIAGLLMGSVSHKVTHLAECACLTVK